MNSGMIGNGATNNLNNRDASVGARKPSQSPSFNLGYSNNINNFNNLNMAGIGIINGGGLNSINNSVINIADNY